MNIRPFTPEDYTAYADLMNAVYSEYPRSVDEFRFWDAHRDPKCKFQRWVVEYDRRLVAMGMYGQDAGMYHPRKFWAEVNVHPEHRGQGIGSTLGQHVLSALQPFDPLCIRTETREDNRDSLRFAQTRGFREEMRVWESRLDVAAFDLAPYTGQDVTVQKHGIEIKTFGELADDPERNHKLFELECELVRDVPSPDEPTPISYEFFLENRLNNPNLLPEAFFVAVDNGTYVGLSALWASQGNNDLYNGLTGVKRSHRRLGIALALKLRGIAYAKARGHPIIKTWNESRNRPMLSINERLGFVKQPAWITFVKELRG